MKKPTDFVSRDMCDKLLEGKDFEIRMLKQSISGYATTNLLLRRKNVLLRDEPLERENRRLRAENSRLYLTIGFVAFVAGILMVTYPLYS